MANIRVLLVDDYPDFLEAAADFLAGVPQIEVVGRANSGQQALDQSAELRPDLVLMDLMMPGMNGLEAAACLKARTSAPRVILLTLHSTPAYRTAAQQAGVDGFLGKDEFGEQFRAVMDALFGEPAVCPEAGQAVAEPPAVELAKEPVYAGKTS